MELTDSIRNKRFDGVLDTHLWKTSNEYTALAALKFCYGEKYKDLIKSEAPDFQDLKNSVAIEVIDSVTPLDAQTAGEFTKIGLAKTEEEKLKRRKKNRKKRCKNVNGRYDGVAFTRPQNRTKRDIISIF